MTRHILVIGVLLIICTAWAGADIMTGTVSSDYSAAGSGLSILIPMLDLSGGRILDSVKIEITSSGHGRFSAQNNDGHSHFATASLTRNWNLSGAGVATGAVNRFFDGGTQDVNPTYNWGRIGYDDDDNGTYYPDVPTYGANYAAIGGGNTSYTLNITQLTNSLTWVTEPNDWSASVMNGLPNFNVTVKYTYTYHDEGYVPEPSTWGLMALGVVGLGIWRRRRSA